MKAKRFLVNDGASTIEGQEAMASERNFGWGSSIDCNKMQTERCIPSEMNAELRHRLQKIWSIPGSFLKQGTMTSFDNFSPSRVSAKNSKTQFGNVIVGSQRMNINQSSRRVGNTRFPVYVGFKSDCREIEELSAAGLAENQSNQKKYSGNKI